MPLIKERDSHASAYTIIRMDSESLENIQPTLSEISDLSLEILRPLLHTFSRPFSHQVFAVDEVSEDVSKIYKLLCLRANVAIY